MRFSCPISWETGYPIHPFPTELDIQLDMKLISLDTLLMSIKTGYESLEMQFSYPISWEIGYPIHPFPTELDIQLDMKLISLDTWPIKTGYKMYYTDFLSNFP